MTMIVDNDRGYSRNDHYQVAVPGMVESWKIARRWGFAAVGLRGRWTYDPQGHKNMKSKCSMIMH